MDRPVAALGSENGVGRENPGHKRVVSKRRDVLVCLDMQCVVGCVQIEKLIRLPGSRGRIAGILLFRGKPIPLVSVRDDLPGRHSHRQRHEEHALVLTTRGREFALRVDDVPKIVEGPLPYGSYVDKACLMRTRHVERFLELCVLSDNQAIDSSRVPDCHRAG
jgi:hypothetical protein